MNSRQKLLILLSVIILTSQIQTVAAEEPQSTVQLEEKTTVSQGSTIFDLHVTDNLLYFLYKGGLAIYNVSDISQVSLVGKFSTSYAHDLYIDELENLAFILDPQNGLIVLDVKDPQNPSELSRYTDVSGTNFFIKDDLLFLGDEENGLKILDISNSSKLTFVASWNDSENNGHVGGVFIEYPYAFLSLRLPNTVGPPTPLELQVLNISDLDNIFEVSEVFDSSDDYAGGSPSYLNEDLLIVSDYSQGIKFINFSDPTNPTLIKTYYDGGEANDFKVVNDYLFVVDGVDGLEILDFTDLNNITKIGSISSGYYMARIDIMASNDLVYLGGVYSGVKVIKYSIDSIVKNTTTTVEATTEEPTTTTVTTEKIIDETPAWTIGIFFIALPVLIIYTNYCKK